MCLRYGLTKWAAEELVKRAAVETGLPVLVARCGNLGCADALLSVEADRTVTNTAPLRVEPFVLLTLPPLFLSLAGGTRPRGALTRAISSACS